MAKLNYNNGVTSVILRVKLLDSTSTTGAGKIALDHTAAGLIISTIADNEASATVYTSAGSTIEAVTTLGTFAAPTATKCRFKKIDDTNHPGVYEIQIADARWAVSNAKSIIVSVQATGVVPVDAEVQLSVVPADVRQWLADAPLALSSQQVQAIVPDTQKVDVNTIKAQAVTCAAGVTVGAKVGAAEVILFTGTGASALVKSDMVDVNGVAYGSSTLNTLASHDPGATIGTSTLTQTQVTGGAYALNNASFAFNSGLDFTTTQKAATLARVTLVDTATATGTLTTYTGNTPQTGDSFARIGATGSGLTSLASAANLAIVAGYIDTEIGTIITNIATLQTDITTIKGYTDDIGVAGAGLTDLGGFSTAAKGQINTEADTALADYDAPTHAEMTSELAPLATAAAVAALTLYASRTVGRGTVGATSPSTTSFTPSALSPAGVAADQFKGRIIVFDNDTATTALRGQATDITASSAAALPLLTYSALSTAPSSGDTFSIV